MGVSQTMNFTIALPTVMKPFPTATVVAASGASVIAVVVVGAGLLVYFRKRKGNS